MLYQWIRLLKANDPGTLTDVSLRNQDETISEVMDTVPTGSSYLYIGQHFPFNNFFMQLDQPNAVQTTLQVQYWGGESVGWKDAVDVLDGTDTSGVPLAKSGVVQFSPNTTNSWQTVADTTNGPTPTELTSVAIYNVYWIRIRWALALTATTSIKRLAYAFTQSQQLDNIDTTINQFLTSFGAAKTDWNDQIMTASIQLVNDLKGRGLIISPGQILRFDDVSMACDYKALELIYSNLGPAYHEKMLNAETKYNRMSSLRRFTFDKDMNAFTDRGEIVNTVSRLVR